MNTIISIEKVPECTYIEGDKYYTNFLINKSLLPKIPLDTTIVVNNKTWEILEIINNDNFIIIKCKGE